MLDGIDPDAQSGTIFALPEPGGAGEDPAANVLATLSAPGRPAHR
ncbi:hypothetical protein [Nonomuraea angiospora]|nr:hypothetical protein [Nonomuraea angiospora]MDX3108755.1 hypothetical protein [Nonomuraea angiospora]